MIRTLFILSIINSIYCADPWSVKIENDGYKLRSSPSSVSSVHAAFYKRLLNMIVSRAVVDDEESTTVVGSLSLLVKQSDWKTLKSYLERDSGLEDDDLRTVDDILFQGIKEESIISKSSKGIFVILKNFVLSTYKFIIGGLLIIFAGYKIKNHSVHLNKRNLIILIIVIIIGWEYMMVYDEFEEAHYSSYYKENLWKRYFHPLYVAKRLVSRVFYGNIKDIFHHVIAHIDSISASAPYFFQTPVKIFLNVSLLFFLLNILFAFILNIILNRPYSMNYLMFGFDLKEKIFRNHQPSSTSFDSVSRNNPIITNNDDKISGENLNTLLKIMHRTKNTEVENSITKIFFRQSRSESQVDGKTKPRRVCSESRLSLSRN